MNDKIKNWWLIAGGIAIGIGVSAYIQSNQIPIADITVFQKKKKIESLYYSIAGAFLIFGAIKGFKKVL